MIKKIVYAFISIFIFIFSTHAQQEFQEDLTQLDFKTLDNEYRKYYKSSKTLEATKYANAYFYKGKKEKDTINIIRGCFYRKTLDKDHHRIDLYDTIIQLTKKNEKYNAYAAVAYYDRGVLFYNNLHYSKALSDFINSYNYNKTFPNISLDYRINLSIVKIKLNVEENQEALDTLKSLWKRVKPYKEKYNFQYNSTLFSLADAYRRLQYIDSAKTYIKLGVLENDNSQKENNHYYLFLLLQELNELNDTHDINTIHKINEIIRYLNTNNQPLSKENASIAYNHIGNSYIKHGNHKEALKSFLKVDSLIQNSTSITLEVLNSYSYLINHYRKKGDLENENKYLRKISSLDSILTVRNDSIHEIIREKYEFPLLLERINKKTKTIIDKKNKKFKTILTILYVTIILGIFIGIYFFVQKNKYKQRFKQLQESNTTKDRKSTNRITKEKPTIPEEIFYKVEKCLTEFEVNKQFLDTTINSGILAQQIGTNRQYFTKAFNYLKNENFNVYLRNIRLGHALERLRNDKIFRKYTIKTIAQESGFSNPESFSKYFYRKYKIYPSYFIKELTKSSQ